MRRYDLSPAELTDADNVARQGQSDLDFRNMILEAGVWRRGEYHFASGDEANNKLDMPHLFDEANRETLVTVVGALAHRVMEEGRPDVVWGVPSGGQHFARAVGEVIGAETVDLSKITTPTGQKEFILDDEDGEETAQAARRLVGIEDVTTTFGSVRGTLQIPQLHKTNDLEVIWHRGDAGPDMLEGTGACINVGALVEEPIPNIITPDHPAFELYEQYARPDEVQE